MAIFDSLKNIFSKQKQETIIISMTELKPWYKKKLEEIFKEANSFTEGKKSKINELIEKTKKDMTVLETEELKNKNIPAREMDIMQGNRKLYIKRATDLLDSLSLPQDISDKNLSAWEEFFSGFKQQLDSFGKSTQKSYYVLQQFFSHESGRVMAGIKDIETNILSVESYIKEKSLTSAILLEGEISKIETIKQEKLLVSEKIKQKTGMVKEKESELVSKNESIKNIEKSPAFSKLKGLEQEKDELLTKKRLHEQSLVHSFAVIEKALLKYQRIVPEKEDEKLIGNYINNPVTSIKNDSLLRICDVMEKTKQAVVKGSVVLKDKKREKTLKAFDELTREELSGFNKKLAELEKNLAEIDENIRNNNAKQTLESIKSETEKLEHSINNEKDELEKLRKNYAGLNLEKQLSFVEERMKIITGSLVKIQK